ncbi:FkbM family methyltransferase [Noviherbaspirillum sp.]|uniref:FkbM family methyltransferase n=1 Tax=Noviherbaspirillum sp. TaxID=1926288 RepID=UPI002FE360C8
MNYPLTPESVVVDLGGYVGDFAWEIHSKYGSRIHIFEPIPAFYERCVARFQGNAKVFSHCYGLGASDGAFEISDAADASSLFAKDGGLTQTVRVRSVIDSFEELGISHIDLLKINIEGGEYEVLPALIASGWTTRVKNFQVQFHKIDDRSEQARNSIRTKLAETHEQTYCYKFVWENWRRREAG